MSDSDHTLPEILHRGFESLRSPESDEREVFASGHPALDAYLDGGFRRGQLHEVFATDAEDNGSAAGFTTMLALCGLQPGKSLLWLRTIDASRRGGRFNSAGFAELGGDPAGLFMVVAPDDTALLRSAADALRCDGFGVIIVECWGSPSILNLTVSRRLTLAANRTGVTAIMLRPGAREQPSTADTRWSVQAAPSVPLEANAPGYPTLDITLLRRRSGAAGKSWRLEWDRDRHAFREPIEPARSVQPIKPRQRTAVSGAVVPISASQQSADIGGLKRSA